MEQKKMVDIICKALSEKKAIDIDIIDIAGTTSLTDAFIICSGNSAQAVKAMADNVEERMSDYELEPLHIDGNKESRWIVLDYGDVIVHIFYEELRQLYAIEKLWSTEDNTTRYED